MLTESLSPVRHVPQLNLQSFLEGTALERSQFVDDLFSGLKDYGFIVLNEHPIADHLINKSYLLLEELFALPLEDKMKYALGDNGFQRGYTPFGQEHAKDYDVMDLKEFWHVGRELPTEHPYNSVYPKNIWPKEIPGFRSTLSEVFQSLDRTGEILLQALTEPLGVESDFFARMNRDGNSILRLLHYPPVPSNVDPRCLRAAPHEDINLITILVSATASGLQLKDRDGTWLPVESSPNSLIVDAGDMLSRITNGVIPSTTHQVVNDPNGVYSSRYSMPFFIHPNPEAILRCLPSCRGKGEKFAPISAQDFLFERLREIGLAAPASNPPPLSKAP